MSQLPKTYRSFQDTYPEVWQAYDRLGGAVHQAGPLDDRSRALVKLALAVGARQEGAVHAHVRKCLDAGLTADEIRHAVLLAMPTVGFPSTVAALSWVEDILTTEA
ncbi:MAG: carboxymuconolactone decarboxylase family protein [Chloroflexi bacterium]|nr:MAG: carboxymuconolactone decarboxylase family protein [Chloroflexota bacterium]